MIFMTNSETVTQGYGSFDYELLDYRPNDLVKVDILLNGDKVDALSVVVHRDRARSRGPADVRAPQGRIAAADVQDRHPGGPSAGRLSPGPLFPPSRKDVTAKCYGGDISRKRKLLEKQKKGKKRMKMVGTIPVPQSAFDGRAQGGQ